MDEKEKSVITEDDNTVSVEEQNASPQQEQKQEVEGTVAVEDDNSPAPEAPEHQELSNESPDPQPVEQTFTQSRVNELVGRARQEGRESALRSLQAAGLQIQTITDTTPIPHNGCRPPKRPRG